MTSLSINYKLIKLTSEQAKTKRKNIRNKENTERPKE